MRRLSAKTLLAATLALAAAPSTAAPVPAEIPVGLLVDLSTGHTLFARETDRRFVPASVTKVMTAYTAFEMIEARRLSPMQAFTYTAELEEAWYGEGSSMFLRAGERPTVGQLLLGITTVSGNDASVALAMAATGSLEVWLDLMNANAARLGMINTHFGSPNGFPDGGQTYTSARDLVLLARAITRDHPELYRRYFGHRKLQWRDITQQNHDPVTGRVRGADGMKTGHTREAGFTFLGTAERDGRRLVVVLAGSPDPEMRDDAARNLLEWGFGQSARHTVLPGGMEVASAEVQDGMRASVSLRTPRDTVTALPPGLGRQGIRMEVHYQGPLEAPIDEGDRVASLLFFEGDRPILDVPLEAAEPVPQAVGVQRIANAFRSWIS